MVPNLEGKEWDCRIASVAMPSDIGRYALPSLKVGQTVVAPSGVRDPLIPRGPYVIVCLLPPIDDKPHYRVKSAADGHERALLEPQIRPVAPEPAPAASGGEGCASGTAKGGGIEVGPRGETNGGEACS